MKNLIAQAKPLGTFEGIGGYESNADGLNKIISNVLGFLTIVAGISFLIYFAIGGLTWITSGGDKGKVETAQKRMTSAAIGMIIIVVAYGIAWIVGEVLGFKLLDPDFDQLNPNN